MGQTFRDHNIGRFKPGKKEQAERALAALAAKTIRCQKRHEDPNRANSFHPAAMRRKLFFNGIAKQGKYLIVFVNHPRGKGEGWPGWHLPMRADDPSVEWWRLYEKQPDDKHGFGFHPRVNGKAKHGAEDGQNA